LVYFWSREYIHCSNKQQERQIRNRKRENLDWELKRFVELNEILAQASQNEYIGKPICTDDLTVQKVCDLIMQEV